MLADATSRSGARGYSPFTGVVTISPVHRRVRYLAGSPSTYLHRLLQQGALQLITSRISLKITSAVLCFHFHSTWRGCLGPAACCSPSCGCARSAPQRPATPRSCSTRRAARSAAPTAPRAPTTVTASTKRASATLAGADRRARSRSRAALPQLFRMPPRKEKRERPPRLRDEGGRQGAESREFCEAAGVSVFFCAVNQNHPSWPPRG